MLRKSKQSATRFFKERAEMKTILYMLVVVAICAISGCSPFNFDTSDPDRQSGADLHREVHEFQAPHYAKLNSIGCRDYGDLELTKSGNFETVDNLIKEKRCFVIPADADVFISERVKTNIVSAKYRDSRELFYTFESNLVAK
jgi:hypothetical protein